MTTELLPDDERIVSLVEEIVSKGAKPSSATVIDWDVAFIADLLCQALNQHCARPARSADTVALAGKLKILNPEVGREPNKAAYDYNVALLEAFRQQTWAAAIEAASNAAWIAGRSGGCREEVEAAIRALTPLERKP